MPNFYLANKLSLRHKNKLGVDLEKQSLGTRELAWTHLSNSIYINSSCFPLLSGFTKRQDRHGLMSEMLVSQAVLYTV